MKYYLKPTIKIEPLIWRWYAWPYLIPPATAACNIVQRHLKIMHSYVQSPHIHAQAVKDPKLLGGPFFDLKTEQVGTVKELIEKTKTDCHKLIELNNALKAFDIFLQNEAHGDTLDNLYHNLPDALKGLVEIVYDLNNKPSIRLIEPLIYKEYYSTAHQTIALSEMNEDHRPFVLSTPRIDQDNEVYLNVPFSDPSLDILFRMRYVPENISPIMEMFDISSDKMELFKSFFTTTPPKISPLRNYNEDGLRIRYLGHACILLQTKNVSILLDPVISYPLENSSIERYTYFDLPDQIDYVILTHNHQDHFMFETLLQLRHKIKHVVFPANSIGSLSDPSIKLILKHIGFKELIELKELESIELTDGQIISLPFLGEHSDLNIQSKLAYFIQLNGHKMLFAADSNNLDPHLYDRIFNEVGAIDMLFLGMECDGAPLSWLYGPLLSQPLKRSFDKNRSLSGSNFEKAYTIMEKSKCKKAYVYAMGQEPWLNYVMALKYSEDSPQMVESNKFIKACNELSIESERLFGRKEWHVTV